MIRVSFVRHLMYNEDEAMTKKGTDRERRELPAGSLRRVAAAFTEQELESIDTWGFEHRIRDRTTVLRHLVQRALATQSESVGADA